MSAPHVPSRVRPQPLMSLSSMITSETLGEMRIASICAPFSAKPRMITYEALTGDVVLLASSAHRASSPCRRRRRSRKPSRPG